MKLKIDKRKQKKYSKLKARIQGLEKIQSENREAVRIALKNKDVAAIKSLSKEIRVNRRKRNGLRDLNRAIRQLWC